MFCLWENDFNLNTVSPNADEQVQNASVLWRGGRSEDTHGEQLQAPSAPQRQKSALFQLMHPWENWLNQKKQMIVWNESERINKSVLF